MIGMYLELFIFIGHHNYIITVVTVNIAIVIRALLLLSHTL